MPPFFKKLNKKAQHTIEYSIIILLVMVGIIIMGPYVIRGWNAQIKSWEDTVIDSLNDPIQVASPDVISLPGCNADPWEDQGCSQTFPATSCHPALACLETQKLMTQNYTPAGCECDTVGQPPEVARCEYDNNCCTAWSPDSNNASVPNPILSVDCGVNAPISGMRADGLDGCPDNEALQTRECGDPDVNSSLKPPLIRCARDPACVVACQEPPPKQTTPLIGYGNLCPNDETGLPDNTINYKYVNQGGCTSGTPAEKCQIECGPGFVSTGSTCECNPPKMLSGASCICDPVDFYADPLVPGNCLRKLEGCFMVEKYQRINAIEVTLSSGYTRYEWSPSPAFDYAPCPDPATQWVLAEISVPLLAFPGSSSRSGSTPPSTLYELLTYCCENNGSVQPYCIGYGGQFPPDPLNPRATGAYYPERVVAPCPTGTTELFNFITGDGSGDDRILRYCCNNAADPFPGACQARSVEEHQFYPICTTNFSAPGQPPLPPLGEELLKHCINRCTSIGAKLTVCCEYPQ